MRIIAIDSATTASATYADVSGPVLHVDMSTSPHAHVKSDIRLLSTRVNLGR